MSPCINLAEAAVMGEGTQRPLFKCHLLLSPTQTALKIEDNPIRLPAPPTLTPVVLTTLAYIVVQLLSLV